MVQNKGMKKERKAVNMITDSPGSALLLFALPMILGNLFQQFYNIMDSVVVGRFVSEEALASVGASYSITNVFIAIAIGGGIGSSVVVSQFLGAKQLGNMKTAISTTLINFLTLSVLLGTLGFLFNEPILAWMNTPENVFADASVYLSIYFVGLPFLFMYNVQAAIFQSLGDSRTPLYLLIFSSLLNIVLDLLFVIRFHQGVAGVAVATLMAQGLSAVISFTILLKRLKAYEVTEAFHFYDMKMMINMMRVAIPSTLQQSIVHIGMLLVQSVVNVFGHGRICRGYEDRVDLHRTHACHRQCHVDLYCTEHRSRAAGPGEAGVSLLLCHGRILCSGHLHNHAAVGGSLHTRVPKRGKR